MAGKEKPERRHIIPLPERHEQPRREEPVPQKPKRREPEKVPA